MDRACSEIKFELDRLRATSENANRKRCREGWDCADWAGEELGNCEWRSEESLRCPIGRGCHRGHPRVLKHHIQLDFWSGCTQRLKVGFIDCALICADRVAKGPRSQHLKPRVAVSVHDQPLINGIGRLSTPPHGDHRCHFAFPVHLSWAPPR